MVPLGKDNYSWVLRSNGTVMHADTVAVRDVALDVAEGDYLVSYLFFIALNGVRMELYWTDLSLILV